MSEDTLSEEFIVEMKKQLEERLHSLRQDLSQLEENALSSTKESSGNLSSMPEHSADLGTDTYEQNRDINEMKREQKELDQVQDALDKIKKTDTADYGICESCGDLIGKERLRAIPYTPHCIDCAKESEASSHAG
jgi:RNA polymerase-binding protein DksA